jgi:hypothetical protein
VYRVLAWLAETLGCVCGSAEWLNSEQLASGPMSERAAGNETPIAAALGAMIAYDGVTPDPCPR